MASVARKRKPAARWVRLPADRAALDAGYYFDPEAAAHACGFFPRYLRHTTTRRWAGRPFELEPWQVDFVSRLYGWKRPDGTRRFREAYLEVPKKNGKSSLLSGLAIFGLFEEPGAEVYPGAVNSKQAGIIYREASRMIAASPRLAKYLEVKAFNKTIAHAKGNSRLEVLSADAESKDGANASLTILDEVHRFANRRLYDVMKYAGAARDQPLLINITTAGYDRRSLCWELHEQASRVLEGATDELEFLGVIYGADRDRDDVDDPATWRKANPSMGVIISESDFRSEYERAKRVPRQLNNFLRLRLGIWTEQATRWLSLPLWDACADPVAPDWWAGQECQAALDLSSVKDLTCLTLAARVGDRVRVSGWAWMPEETAAERSDRDGVPYRTWIDRGHMIETPGNATDHDAIRRKLNELRDAGAMIRRVGLDPWNAAQLAVQLAEDGFEVAMVRQGYGTLSAPSKELERLLLAGNLRHDGSPVTRWAVGNVAAEEDPAGNIKPSKRKSTERIDPVVSMVMAIALLAGPAAPAPGLLAL